MQHHVIHGLLLPRETSQPSPVAYFSEVLGLFDCRVSFESVISKPYVTTLCDYVREPRFAEEEEAADLVEEIAVAMLPLSGYGSREVLRGPALYFEWQPDEVRVALPVDALKFNF